MVKTVLGVELITVNELAEVLNVEPRTIRLYVKQGKLKGAKYGSGWHFTTDEVRRFISGGTVNGSDQRKETAE